MAEKYAASLTDLEKSLTQVDDKLANIRSEIDNVKEHVNDLTDAEKKGLDDIEKKIEAYERLHKKIEEIVDAQNKTAAAHLSYDSVVPGAPTSIDRWNEYVDALLKVHDIFVKLNPEAEKTAKVLEDINKGAATPLTDIVLPEDVTNYAVEVEGIVKAENELMNSIKEENAEIENNTVKKKEAEKAATEHTEALKKEEQAIQNINNVLANNGQQPEPDLTELNNDFVKLASNSSILEKSYQRLHDESVRWTKTYQTENNITQDKFEQVVKMSAAVERSRQPLLFQLESWKIKNKGIVDSNKQIQESYDKLVEAIRNAKTPEEINKAKLQAVELKEETKEVGKESQAAYRLASTSADAYASSIARTAALLEAKLIDGIYRLSTQAVRGIIKEVQTLDEELVEIRKVTDFTERELKTFVQSVREIGNATATTTSDLLEASAVFARSGYTKEQILQLTEEAAILKNVSDNIDNMSKSAEILISVMKAYNIPASQARTITDQLNNISNNAAISFDDLAEGIQRVGAVFATTGTSIGELSAMLTGANEILQNIEKTSTGLSTISERIRGIKGVTEDGIGVAKLDDLMTTITARYGEAVHVIDQSNGQLRSTYDILYDLAQVWDKLSANERQELGEKIAGKRQITVLNALLQNWESVEVAINNVEGSAGSALREQQAYINSLTGAINQFKAAVQNMYQGALESDILTFIVKIGTVLVNAVDKLGVFNIVLGALAVKVSSLFNAFGVGRNTIEGIKNIILEVNGAQKRALENADGLLAKAKVLLGLKRQVKAVDDADVKEYAKLLMLDAKHVTTASQRIKLATLQQNLTERQKLDAAELLAYEEAINGVRSFGLGLLVTAIGTLVSWGLPKLLNWIGESGERTKNIVNKVNEINTEIGDIQNKINDINQTIESNSGYATKQQIEDLKQYNLQLDLANQKLKEQKAELGEIMKQSSGNLSNLSYIRFKDPDSKKNIVANINDYKEILGETETLTKESYERLLEYFSEKEPLMTQLLSLDDDVLDEDAIAIREMFEKMEEMAAEYANSMEGAAQRALTGETFDAAYKTWLKNLGDGASELDVVIAALNSFGMSTEDAIKYLAKLNDVSIDTWTSTKDNIVDTNFKMKDYISLYNEAIHGISGKDILDIVENWSKYADVLKIENGQLKINKQAVIDKAKAEVNAQIAILEARRENIESQITQMKAERAYLTAVKTNTEGTLDGLSRQASAISKVTKALVSRNKAMAGDTSEANANIAENMAAGVAAAAAGVSRISQLDAAIAAAEKELSNVNAQIKYLQNLDVEKYLKKAAEETNKAGKSTKSATKETKKANEELTKLQALLKALQDQLSKTSDVYKKVQEEMKKLVEEEKDGLEDANDVLDENIKYYEARIKLVEEALKSEIEGLKAQKKAAEDANKAQQDAIEDRIKALKEETKLYEKNNKAEQEAIDAQVDALEEQIKAIDEAAKAQEDALSVQEKLLEIEKARLALEKAKDAYEQAKNNKTVRTYDAELGWIYTADQSAVNAAYGEYQGAQKNLDDLLKEYADMMAENEREAQKAAIQAQIDELKAQKETLKDLLEQVKEDAEQQEEALKSEKELLEEQKEQISDSFQQQIDALDAQNDSLDNISDNVEKAVDKYLSDTEVQDWFARYMAASEEERVEMMNALEDIWRTDAETQRANEEEIDRLDTLLDEIDKMLEVQDYSVSASEGVKEWLDTFKQVTYEDRRAMVSEMHDAYQEFYTEQSAQIAKVQEAIDNIEGNINITTQLLQHWGTGEYNTPVNNYANGGVVDSGLLHHTGMLSDNVKVHGNPASPELILNGKQQANLLYRLAKQAPSSTTINNANGAGSIYVATLNIQADSQDTLHGLLLQAKQLATVS